MSHNPIFILDSSIKNVSVFYSNHTFNYNGVNLSDSYTSPLAEETVYSYDKNKRLTHIEKPSGATIENIYTKGRLSPSSFPRCTW